MVSLRIGRSQELLLQPCGMVELRVPSPGEVQLAVRVRGLTGEALSSLQGDRQDVTVDWGDGPCTSEEAHIGVRLDEASTDEQVTCVEISLREVM